MKPSIIKAGICTAVTAAVTMTLSGLLPSTAGAAPTLPDFAGRLVGKTVFLDPGHQGPNHSEDLTRQVSDGRGGTKECQTTGMTTVNGVPEHTINWNVAQLVKVSLETLGANVLLSRQDDTGWGGCIDERARAANQSGAAIAVSIHADSAPAAYRGFHTIIPALPIPDATVHQVQSGPGLAVTKAVRDAYLQAGFPSANYAGVVDGLQTRADIAGPALTAVPQVFLEMGNGANPEDAALLESGEGQLRHAIAITTGLVGYLLGVPHLGARSDQPAFAPNSLQTGVPQAQVVPGTPQGTVPGVPQAQVVPGTPQGTVPGVPQARVAPGTPQGTAPGTPQAQTVPGTPQSQSTPGSTQSPSTPGAQLVPGVPGTQQSPSGQASAGDFVAAIIQQLAPLARSLGIDDSILTSELITMANALAGALLSALN
ncbi:N-acetylmuramoyl-L-alanine amidase [Nocardia sp. NPDC049220]|uniref:N-acetylmuramoyl-L-alanine amidase n=1 Tax=Nocardia sp. NPDC049220 TaxID=3155273 RepID=UPI003411E569